MSIRKWYTDEQVTDNEVILTVDVTGIDPNNLYVGISNKFNSLVIYYNGSHERDVPISVKILDEFEHYVNNGVLTVKIKRLIDDN